MPAQRKRRHVDPIPTHDTANVTEHARHIVVLQESHMAIERRFAMNTVHLNQPRAFQNQRALHPGGWALIGFDIEPDGIHMRGTLLMLLGKIQSAVSGNLNGIDGVGLPRERAIQDASKPGILINVVSCSATAP